MSQAVRTGAAVIVSGQVGLDATGKLVSDDPYEQAKQSLVNVQLALEGVGATLSQVTKLVCYLTDPGHFPAYSTAKREIFGPQNGDDAPASTTVVVAALLDPRMLIEVEAYAYIAEPAPAELDPS
ncbi:RidA family protein [Nocardioides marmoriginsengisoli]|uniref:RidA family protein n=2 Tax=Nocardioides marmoriginsengisoli TaxID=661483 RepID=A0A3N0CEG3_9ACTN|nr:RidA family protein [Nocardioides marmoriginsengisoli]